MMRDSDRRRFLTNTGVAALGLATLPALRGAAATPEKEQADEVEAAEDLMREHGVIRRALLVYAEAATRLSNGLNTVSPDALASTAALFRSFGEDYHERSLEEKHVFPPLIKGDGAHAAVARTLIAQHERGRQITDYIVAVTRSGRIHTADATPLANVLTAFVRMYEHHAAIEDTVIFPAWKAAISADEYRARSEQFEDLEQRMFGRDGFEDAVKRIAAIEERFGLADLSALTAPAPPKTAA
jgi:hemerythrin-like domain-containing protein